MSSDEVCGVCVCARLLMRIFSMSLLMLSDSLMLCAGAMEAEEWRAEEALANDGACSRALTDSESLIIQEQAGEGGRREQKGGWSVG